MRRSLARLSIPFREPYVTAGGVVAERELALLRLEDDDGAVGLRRGRAVRALRRRGAGRRGRRRSRTATSPAATRRRRPAPRGSWRCWTWRRAARGAPLGEPGAEAIAVNRTLPAGPPEEVARHAADGVRDGFSCFKVKVGLPDDAERVAAVREAIGPWPALRIDANGAWSVEEAVVALGRLFRYDLQLVEQPCRDAAPSWPSCGATARCRSPPTSRSPRADDVRAAGRRWAPATWST